MTEGFDNSESRTEFDDALANLTEVAKAGRYPVAELARLDDAYIQAGGRENVAQERKARTFVTETLRSEPVVLGRVAFAAGLTGRASAFFLRTSELCAEQEEGLTPEQLAIVIGGFRRGDGYEGMQRQLQRFTEKIAGDESASAWALRSKVTYEEHMAAFQAAGFADDAEAARAFLERSMVLAERSIDEANRADDRGGWLNAKMNIGGLLMPALGRRSEGIRMSEHVLAESEGHMLAAPNAEKRARLSRVAMNACLHLLKNGVEEGMPKERIDDWFTRVQTNEVYRMAMVDDQPPEFARETLNAARRYLGTTH